MSKTLLRIGLVVVALAAVILGLNLMNVRNDIALLAGGVATVGGLVLGGRLLWGFYKGVEK